jgi:cytochrome c556
MLPLIDMNQAAGGDFADIVKLRSRLRQPPRQPGCSMSRRLLQRLILAGAIVASSACGRAAEPAAPPRSIQLSAAVRNLLLAEMREIASGIQGMALAIAIGDWSSIQSTSTSIRESYIMEKKLTPAQAEELERALPQRFKELDAEFHLRAQRLGAAAAAHDAELVAYHYSRLIESCTTCHAAYAGTRFPEFAARPQVH